MNMGEGQGNHTMEQIKCIFCEKDDNQIVIEESGYTGRRCCHCGLIYVSPRPTINEIQELYKDNKADKSAEVHMENELFKRLHARHNLRIITSFVEGGTILDIGAGAGYFLDEARKQGFNPYAIELNHIQADYIRNTMKIPCEESSLHCSSFSDTDFDVIYHCDVISHFFDPIFAFKEINEKMKEGSFLVFETGNLGEVAPKYFKLYRRFSYPDHLFFFSTDNLKDLCEKSGFRFVKIYRYSMVPELVARQIFSSLWSSLSKHEKHQRTSVNGGKTDKVLPKVNFLIATLNNSPAKKIIRNTLYYFGYLLRYKVGYMVPKKNQPQTVIVIAQKQKS